ncbi:sialoadhesin-like isoform X2 [Perca fluviatilis]|uniref:sialoadhesin-like isoform X2 n=1 Tax=Perca fluviatilis TaxID=8168 RepID=UPI001964FE3D|nr:sialoadhesin-like isoform X2 [Perca fluviatilis]
MKAPRLFLLLFSFYQTTLPARVSVTISPSRSQHFEYEKLSVDCGDWTAWRYTTNSWNLSQCELGWGAKSSSSCEIGTAKATDSGVYWCQSRHGDSSNVVNITVTGGPVTLQSPVLPVPEGEDVMLRCIKRNSSALPAEFYKDGVSIGRGAEGNWTRRRFSRSDEGFYKCKVGNEESPPSWLLMKDDSVPASLLSVSPDVTQLFEYDGLSLSCGNNSRSHGWRIIRATKLDGKEGMLVNSSEKWGEASPSGFRIHAAKKTDSGVYWCESPARQRSNSLSISFYGTDKIILQSPGRPVMEGDNVTLHCKTNQPWDSLPGFYKDGSFIRTERDGHMTIHNVSRSDEGLYKCNISTGGESPPSWLFVRGDTFLSPQALPKDNSTDEATPSTSSSTSTDASLLSANVSSIAQDSRSDMEETSSAGSSPPSVLTLIRHLVVICPYCISTVLLVSICRQKPKGNSNLLRSVCSCGRKQRVSMAMSPPREDDQGADRAYENVIPDVTTEHNF